MFNLLKKRRSKKNKIETQPNASDKTSHSAEKAQHQQQQQPYKHHDRQHRRHESQAQRETDANVRMLSYRQLSEGESENVGATIDGVSADRAAIGTTNRREDHFATLGRGDIYFRKEEEKVNLAKTTAAASSNLQNSANNGRAFASNHENPISEMKKIDVAAADRDTGHRHRPQSSANEQTIEWPKLVSRIGANQTTNDDRHDRKTISGNNNGQDEDGATRISQVSKPIDWPTAQTALAADDAKDFVAVAGSSDNGNGSDNDTTGARAVIGEVRYRNSGYSGNTGRAPPAPHHNEAKRQSRLSLTLGFHLAHVATKGAADANGERQKGSRVTQSLRKSLFAAKTKSLDSDDGRGGRRTVHPQQELRPKEVAATKRRPLQKSKEFLSDIFMARGRHHHRNHNNNQEQNSPVAAPPSQQQQEEEQQLQQEQHAPVAPISESDSNPTTMSSDRSADSHDRLNDGVIAHLETVDDDGNEDRLAAPLVSASTYRMTASKNSDTKNSSRIGVRGDHDESGDHNDDRVARDDHEDRDVERVAVARTHSADDQLPESESPETDRANVNKTEESERTEQSDQRLNSGHDAEQRRIILAPNIDRTGGVSAPAAEASDHVESESESETSERTITETDVSRSRGETVDGVDGADGAGDRQFNELTECDRDHRLQLQQSKGESVKDPNGDACDACDACDPLDAGATMGQANTKNETSSRSSVPREFRESKIPPEGGEDGAPAVAERPKVVVPTITVEDFSSAERDGEDGGGDKSPLEKEVFYDFENENENENETENENEKRNENGNGSGNESGNEKCNGAGTEDNDEECDEGLRISAVEVEFEEGHDDGIVVEVEGDETLVDGRQGDTIDLSRNKWPPAAQPAARAFTPPFRRFSPTKLEDVPEQQEEEEDDENDEPEENNDDDLDDDEEEEEAPGEGAARDLDNDLYNKQYDDSPERQTAKSTNTSDSNLSTSLPDSGIGDSQAVPENAAIGSGEEQESGTLTIDGDGGGGGSSNGSSTAQQQSHQRMPFVRDGDSTDCEETLMQCDEPLDYTAECVELLEPNERLVCIESISLPDVVVESTAAGVGGGGSSNASASGSTGSATSLKGGADGGAEREIINVNGANGNSVGNMHFIPIRLEGGDAKSGGGNGSGSGSGGSIYPKRRSLDDSVIGSGGKRTSFGHQPTRPTIEIVEDATELTGAPDVQTRAAFHRDDAAAEKLKRELLEQKSHFSRQLEDAQNTVHGLQAKVDEMQTKIEKLEQELSAKTWNVERLQGELRAALRDDEYVRKKLLLLEEEKTDLRHRFDESEDDFRRKYEELEKEYNELQQKYNQTQSLASQLQAQLSEAQSEVAAWREEVEKIREDLDEQVRVLRGALANSEAERRICEDRWQREFEMMRTQNIDREESIMTDCEWQLRQMRKQCKERLDQSDQERDAAAERAEELESELEERQKEVASLRVYQAQVNSLRGIVNEQEQSIHILMKQIESLKNDLDSTKKSLEEQIAAVKKIKCQCDNALRDKERHTVRRIDEVRNEAAAFWENKLYTEMTRLKSELESVFVDERREALDRLQAEHVEELRALTTRYTANEEELRSELGEMQEQVDLKNREYLELRDKSDSALLHIRMLLDRADREYQKAMCREDERREALEESLRKEFEAEKRDMEAAFQERLGQAKDEYGEQLKSAKQELTQKHKKELEHLRAKLVAEKEEALQELAERHRKKLAMAEERIKEVELRHSRDLQDLKAAYDTEKASLDKRDLSNASEIEQLHRKCRCLTNLFEEMRMRYERRDPRPEDLREIAELRSRCEAQERDLYLLTERLRELQIRMSEEQQNGTVDHLTKKKSKQVKKPPPKTIPTNCDVIYEENEERDSPPPPPATLGGEAAEDGEGHLAGNGHQLRLNGVEEEECSEERAEVIGGDTEFAASDKQRSVKDIDTINEADSQMISAV